MIKELTCKDCKYFVSGGDFGTCCQLDYNLHYEESKICDRFMEKTL